MSREPTPKSPYYVDSSNKSKGIRVKCLLVSDLGRQCETHKEAYDLMTKLNRAYRIGWRTCDSYHTISKEKK